MLELDGLTRRFGDTLALDGLTFDVHPGRVSGFLGPNGAGKTTTMRAIFGLTDLDAGTVRWNERPVDLATRRRFGYMPEERGIYPAMTVGEQVAYFARLHGVSGHEVDGATRRCLERLGIPQHAGAKVETLSHGNQQRVQLAIALVHEPDLLVLDEPLAGLDPGGIDSIADVLREEAQRGCTVLLSSHQLDLVEDLCETVTIIDHGRVVIAGDVDDLTTHGDRRLVVRVDGDRSGRWAGKLRGVRISEIDAGAVRLALGDRTNSDKILDAARAAGRVTEFHFERRRLSEVFREALG